VLKALGFKAMKNIWEERAKPSIEHITSLFENEVLGAFLTGHLILESVLVLMLETTPNDSDKGEYFDWSFYRKVNAAEARSLICSGMARFLHEVNGIRTGWHTNWKHQFHLMRPFISLRRQPLAV
jgi:hypothetical protein